MAALRGRNAERAKVAARWLVDLQAAVFVDAMRMFYVGASATARGANVHRYAEFRRMAEHHFADLDRQTDRYAAELEPEIFTALRVVEPRLRWTISELAPQPIQPSAASRYFHQMHGTAGSLAHLCGLASLGSYSATRKMVDEIARSNLSPSDGVAGRMDYNLLFGLRLRTQTRLLNETQSGERLPLRTIADDSSQSLAVPYFVIDEWLLNWALE